MWWILGGHKEFNVERSMHVVWYWAFSAWVNAGFGLDVVLHVWRVLRYGGEQIRFYMTGILYQ